MTNILFLVLVIPRCVCVDDRKKTRVVSPGEGTAASLVISDYEEAIMNSFRTTFLGARVRGCWFHFGQVKRTELTKSSISLKCIYSS